MSLDNETRQMFADTIERLLPAADNRTSRESPDVWEDLSKNGVLALGLSERVGGLGGGMTDIGLVMRSLGSSLANVPFVSTVVLCAWLIEELAPHNADSWLAAILAGELKLSLAHQEPASGYAAAPLHTRATGNGSIVGVKAPVLDVAWADAFLVTAIDEEGVIRLYRVDKDAAGLSIETRRSVDGRMMGTLSFRETPGILLGTDDASELVRQAGFRANVALCAEAVGAMESIAEQTREYLKTRRAFGKTLSEFQVLQHRFVDILIALEEARSAVDAAEASCDRQDGDQEIAARTCKVATASAARFVSGQGIQLHGGVGMTDELVISHYYKRLMAVEAAFGNADHHLQALARLAEARFLEDSGKTEALL